MVPRFVLRFRRRTHTHTHIDGWTVTTDTPALRNGLAWSTIMSFGKVQTSNGQRTVHERPLSVDFPAWVPRWISVDSAEISENPELVRHCLTRIFRKIGRVPENPHATRNDKKKKTYPSYLKFASLRVACGFPGTLPKFRKILNL